jgi:hypothetical protein
MAVMPGASFHHVTGTITVNIITVQGYSPPEYHPEKIFHGPIRRIADDDPGFTLGHTGNIKPKSPAPRVRHEVVTVFFDPDWRH